MIRNQNEGQNNEEKVIDPSNALQKVIRLDRKHSNFDYYDTLLNFHIRVAYSKSEEPPPGQHLLKQFWKHCSSFYFKKIENSQLERLKYVEMLIHPKNNGDFNFSASPQFWGQLQTMFNQNYFKKSSNSQIDQLNKKNLLSILYSYYRIIQNLQGKPTKKLNNQIQNIQRVKIKQKQFKNLTKNYRRMLEVLKEEQYLLNEALPQKVHLNDEVSKQIAALERQLKEVNAQNRQIYKKIDAKVSKQINSRQFIYCINNQDDERQIEAIMNNKHTNMYVNFLQEINQVNQQLKFLKYKIEVLEKRQIAQSINKILKIQRNRGDYRFSVSFQQGMNLKMKIMTEEQLKQFNNLREYSLVKFYNTSLKSRYSFICQNFYGFREIYNNRNNQCKSKNKDVLQLMKKHPYQSHDHSTREFKTFQICHHCKLLYPQQFLQSCNYNSTRSGVPSMPSSYCDSYLMQISKVDGSSSRFSTRRRNCLFGYSKKNDEYCCQRKFCKYCLKHSYPDGMDKNGLCPFCQGICFCTRCSRNQMIIKLKSIYHLYGGDINQLQKNSELDKLQQMQQETSIVRRKGRPKKSQKRNSISNINVKSNYKMSNIRYGLQHIRMLSDMVKRRQKKKHKIIEGNTQMFVQRTALISQDFQPKRALSKSTLKQNQDPQLMANKKPRKRLHLLN